MFNRLADLLTDPGTRTARFELGLFALMALSMMATREHHFSSVLHLADTSWAVFFMAGLYLRPRWMLAALIVLALSVDLFAVWHDGLALSGCFSPAYPGLLLAYGALWAFGRKTRQDWTQLQTTPRDQWMMPLVLVGSVLLGVLSAFALSNLTFWGFSGHFDAMPLGEYTHRVMGYLSGYLTTTLLDTGFAVALIMGWVAITTRHSDSHTTRPA
jgi:hypothetical protein